MKPRNFSAAVRRRKRRNPRKSPQRRNPPDLEKIKFVTE